MANVFNGNVPSLTTSPVSGGFWADFGRNPLGSYISPHKTAEEDWLRAEQSANNAFARDMYYLYAGNDFNADEAQKQRDYEERLSNTAYQRAMVDMKKAGINPIMGLGFSNMSASTPTGSTASSSGGRSSPAHSQSNSSGNALGAILSLVAGLLTKGKGGQSIKHIVDGDGVLTKSIITTRK